MRPNSSHTGKRRKNRSRGSSNAPTLKADKREACEAAIEYRFTDPELLDRAMSHRSAVRGRAAAWSNERLEFLGDRVLGLVIVEALLGRFPKAREGDLAPRLGALVSRDACAVVGGEIGLSNYILVDQVERASGGPNKRSLLANAVEALIGAIYMDGGQAAAETFILKHWKAHLAAMEATPRDPKSALQEWAQAKGHPTPVYKHESRTGPDHAPVFTTTVEAAGLAPATGTGASKQAAERAAAQAMLASMDKPKRKATT